ncbi:MAG: MerR family transcriptional regulator [Polyangiales bacterium]
MRRTFIPTRRVCQIVGISSALLRAWESRHGLVSPRREENNYRRYSESDVRVLLRAKQLVDGGLPISEVARLGRRALLASAPPVAEVVAASPRAAAPPRDACAGVIASAARALASEGALQGVAEAAVAQSGSCFARIWAQERDPRWLRLAASAGLSTRVDDSPRARIDLLSYPYMVGWVARTQHRMVRGELASDPRFDAAWVTREGLVSAVVAPLESDRQLVGVMAAFYRRALRGDDRREIDVLAKMATAAIVASSPAARPSRRGAEAADSAPWSPPGNDSSPPTRATRRLG